MGSFCSFFDFDSVLLLGCLGSMMVAVGDSSEVDLEVGSSSTLSAGAQRISVPVLFWERSLEGKLEKLGWKLGLVFV